MVKTVQISLALHRMKEHQIPGLSPVTFSDHPFRWPKAAFSRTLRCLFAPRHNTAETTTLATSKGFALRISGEMSPQPSMGGKGKVLSD